MSDGNYCFKQNLLFDLNVLKYSLQEQKQNDYIENFFVESCHISNISLDSRNFRDQEEKKSEFLPSMKVPVLL